MTSDERALQYLADANPIPDLRKLGQRSFESIDLPATRRRRLTETEGRRLMSAAKPRRSRPRWAAALAAAVVVVAAGVGSWFFFAGDGEDPVAGDPDQPTVDTGLTLDKSEPWDLVWFSDSGGEWVAEEWADLIEAAEGVEVRVHDHVVGGATIDLTRQWLDLENIRREVAEAEIIVVYNNPSSNTAPPDTHMCAATPSSDPEPPAFYTSADFAPYGDVLRGILDVIFELRAGRPTVIRVLDQAAVGLADWREVGIEAECTATWEALSAAIREAADEYGVATASIYDLFNGPDHDEDPREKGYIAGGSYYPSREGAVAKAEFLHSLGYGAIIP